MDRREFVRMLGAGGLLAALGLIAGGCPAREQAETGGAEPELPPMPPEDQQPEADNGEDGEGAAAPADEASAVNTIEQASVKCPNCGAENEVDEWGVEITCWKCGHQWTPEKPA